MDEEIPFYSGLDLEDDTLYAEEIDDGPEAGATSGCFALEPPASKAALTHNDFSREQLSDPLCKEVASRLARGDGSAQLRLLRFFINTEGLICRKAHLDGVKKVVVPTTLCDRMLYLSH